MGFRATECDLAFTALLRIYIVIQDATGRLGAPSARASGQEESSASGSDVPADRGVDS